MSCPVILQCDKILSSYIFSQVFYILFLCDTDPIYHHDNPMNRHHYHLHFRGRKLPGLESLVICEGPSQGVEGG